MRFIEQLKMCAFGIGLECGTRIAAKARNPRGLLMARRADGAWQCGADTHQQPGWMLERIEQDASAVSGPTPGSEADEVEARRGRCRKHVQRPQNSSSSMMMNALSAGALRV